jgi:hypothetical protein
MKNFLLFLVAGVLFISAFEVFGQEAQTPVYKEGECWVFRSMSKNYQGYVSGVLALPANGDHKICFLERKFFEMDGGTKSQISTGSLWNNILYMRENPYLKFPLIVGQKRTEDFETRIRGTNRRKKGTSETTVLGVEQIASSAEAYQAFKIETNHWCGGKSCGRYTYFYSPQTKSVVIYNYQATLGSTATWEVDLIDFSPSP